MKITSSLHHWICIALIAFILPVSSTLLAQEEDSGSATPSSNEGDSNEDGSRRVRRLGDVESDEWKMDLSIPSGPTGQEQNSQYDLPDAEQNARLQQLLSSLATNPGNRKDMDNLDALLSEVLLQADELAGLGSLDDMEQLLGIIRYINLRKAGLEEAFNHLQNLRNVDGWLLAASQAMNAGMIIEPEGSSTLYFLDRVLAVDPENERVQTELLKVQTILIDRALQSARELDFEQAEEWLYESSLVRGPQDLVEEAGQQVAAYQARQVDKIEQNIFAAIAENDFDKAEFDMIDLIALVGNDARVQALRSRLGAAKRYGQYSPGEVIRDALKNAEGTAPAVVVIKSGSFLMGSPESEAGRSESEGPQHRVTLERGFALGLHEVTVSEFRTFVEATRFRTQAETVGNSRVYNEQSARIASRENVSWAHDYQGKPARDNDPVIHIDWYDSQAYADWLSEQTGKKYRLPTESEFEYAIRAGSVTQYWWGDDRPEQLVENLTGSEDESVSGRRWTAGFRRYEDGYWGPAPVASFMINSLGIFDLAGNVSEWVEDCWHQTYSLAPADGTAWVNPGCQRRVVRGGYWAGASDQARSASRLSAAANLHGPRVGMRIARDL
ncbi:MAG: sulfatase activating formylglycine-generating enzyme [Lysobacterales bacterium]|jgi:formylglycine-generating enzyme required for sulfatase activity